MLGKKYSISERHVALFIRLFLSAAFLAILVPLGACLNSGVGGDGQACNRNGFCKDTELNVGEPDLHIICCPNTSTCITETECYGTILSDLTGGENQPCNVDGSCNSGLVCCSSSDPIVCTTSENCSVDDGDIETDGDITIDGDEDAEDGDPEEDGDSDGDLDHEISFPEKFLGLVCTDKEICWESPWPVGHTLNAIWATSSVDDTLWIVGDGGTRIGSDKESFNGLNGDIKVNLNGVGGTDNNDLWAAGDDGMVYHFDGEDWILANDPVFNSIRTDEIDLTSVLSDGIGNTYVIGEQGVLLKHLDGAWSKLSSSTNSLTLNDMFAIPGKFYMIVGDQGRTIISEDQVDFSRDIRSTSLSEENFNAVWGRSKIVDEAEEVDQVFVVGDNETILFFDGSTWYTFGITAEVVEDGDIEEPAVKRSTRAAVNLTGIAGYGNAVYIVGTQGAVYKLTSGENSQYAADESAPDFLKTHFWKKLDTPSEMEIMDVSVTEYGEVFVIGQEGTIWATAPGQIWHEVNRAGVVVLDSDLGMLSHPDITGLFGDSTRLFTAYSNGLIRWQDTASGDWTDAGQPMEHPAKAIWIDANGQVYLFNSAVWKLKENGEKLMEADNDLLNTTVEKPINSVWGFSDGTIYAVADRIIRYADNSWSEVTNEAFHDWSYIGQVDGDLDDDPDEDPDEDDKDSDTAKRNRADGDLDTEGEVGPVTPVSGNWPWNAVWGSSVNDIWVVGQTGWLAHRAEDPDAAGTYIWKTIQIDDEVDLTGIWGEDSDAIWITGKNGNIWYSDGSVFTHLAINTAEEGEDFTRIWGTDGNHIFVLSSLGNLYFSRNGAVFEKWSTGFSGYMNQIWGPTVDQLYLAGEKGVLLQAIEAFDQTRK